MNIAPRKWILSYDWDCAHGLLHYYCQLKLIKVFYYFGSGFYFFFQVFLILCAFLLSLIEWQQFPITAINKGSWIPDRTFLIHEDTNILLFIFRLALSKLFPSFWKQERTVPRIHKLVSLDENYLCFSSSKQALDSLTYLVRSCLALVMQFLICCIWFRVLGLFFPLLFMTCDENELSVPETSVNSRTQC